MRGQTYRLNTPTLSILDRDGHKTPLTIPMGGTVEIVEEHIDRNRLVDVKWEGKRVLIFTTDLRERGELVTGADA